MQMSNNFYFYSTKFIFTTYRNDVYLNVAFWRGGSCFTSCPFSTGMGNLACSSHLGT